MSVLRRRSGRVLFTLLATTVLATTVFATVGATSASATPDSGDGRATAYDGNIKDGGCAAAGLAGEQITVTFDSQGTYIDITALQDGYTGTGVVIKGSDAYNVYAAEKLGGLAWLDLHAPLNESGNPAEVSHWLACGSKTGSSESGTEGGTEGEAGTEGGTEGEAGTEGTDGSEDVEGDLTDAQLTEFCESLLGPEDEEFAEFLKAAADFTDADIVDAIAFCEDFLGGDDAEAPPAKVAQKADRAAVLKKAELPDTGAEGFGLGVAGLALIAAGGLAVAATRRRGAHA